MSAALHPMTEEMPKHHTQPGFTVWGVQGLSGLPGEVLARLLWLWAIHGWGGIPIKLLLDTVEEDLGLIDGYGVEVRGHAVAVQQYRWNVWRYWVLTALLLFLPRLVLRPPVRPSAPPKPKKLPEETVILDHPADRLEDLIRVTLLQLDGEERVRIVTGGEEMVIFPVAAEIRRLPFMLD